MNNILLKLFKYKTRASLRYLKSQTAGKLITVAIGTSLLLGVSIVIYRFGVSGLRFIQSFILYRDAFTLYIYELYLAVIFYLACASSILFMLFTLLRSNEDDWILSTPKFNIIPIYYLGKISSSSLISLSILVVPLILAMRTVFGLGIAQSILIAINVFLLLMTAIFISMIIVFGISKIFHFLEQKDGQILKIQNILISCILIFIVLIALGWKMAIPTDFIEFWQIPVTDIKNFDIDLVSERFTYFPSHINAKLMFSLGENRYGQTANYLACTTLITGVGYFIILALTRNFLPIWQKLQEGSFEARTKVREKIILKVKHFPRYLKGSIGALFEKELLVLGRDLKDISWIGFILSLWLIYTGINLIMKAAMSKYDFGSEELSQTIYALQIAVGIYFITAFVLRFVFPTFSTERKTAWIIGTAPIKLLKVMYSKLLFFSSTLSILAVLVSLFNFTVFRPGGADILIYLILFITTIITITMFGMFLGFVFPNFETDNPEILGTSLPGIIFTLTAILYGALGAFIYYAYIHSNALQAVLLFEVISLIIFAVMLQFSPKFLKKIEFGKGMLVA